MKDFLVMPASIFRQLILQRLKLLEKFVFYVVYLIGDFFVF